MGFIKAYIKEGEKAKRAKTKKCLQLFFMYGNIISGHCSAVTVYGPVVKRLRHRPFTAVTRVRFPSGSFARSV